MKTMNENNKKLLAMLPQELKELKIEERHKVLLVSKKVGAMMWTEIISNLRPAFLPRLIFSVF